MSEKSEAHLNLRFESDFKFWMENIIKYITNLEKDNKTIVDFPDDEMIERGDWITQIRPNKDVKDDIKTNGKYFEIISWDDNFHKYDDENTHDFVDGYSSCNRVICAILLEASRVYDKIIKKKK
jgi:hypothetical protein